MEISNNLNRYDSTIQPNSKQNIQVNPKNSIKQFNEAFKVEISQRAMTSLEFNDESINFPVHNEDVLQYSENLSLTFKP
ncbi:hypothetical protein ACMC56_11050 [Campylobacterota bacterium DY0563]|uniref:hypothetical protein n=1 Tax=Halarcobacter sp. TaxID=2321133 RepID=UPI0029F4EA04|nr:hypothetical protein [Halarcobacter sp.]